MKPSTRERVVALTWSNEQYFSPLLMDDLHSEKETPFMLNQVIHGKDVDAEMQLRHRRLSMSTLVVDLALIFTKKA